MACEVLLRCCWGVYQAGYLPYAPLHTVADGEGNSEDGEPLLQDSLLWASLVYSA